MFYVLVFVFILGLLIGTIITERYLTYIAKKELNNIKLDLHHNVNASEFYPKFIDKTDNDI